MKQFTPRLFLVLFIALFFSSCSDPVKVGSVSISINYASIGDAIDQDGDGYHSSANIYFEVETTEETDVTFVIQYKVAGGSYTFYKETSQYTISGTSSWFVSLGNTGYELPQGCYDFSIEVHRGSEMKASLTAEEEFDIQAFCMERPDQELANVTIDGAWIDDREDVDGDGYHSAANIYLQVTTSQAIDVTFVIKYKLDGQSVYTEYKETSQLNISGTSTWFIALGNSGYELPMDCYDFALEVYSASNMLASLTAEQASDIGAFCMETPEEDVLTLTLHNTTYTNMDITVINVGTQVVSPGSSAFFNFDQYPGTISIHAATSGRTSTNTVIGLELEWNFDLDLTTSYENDLVVSNTYFFMRMRNAGDVPFSPVYVNWEHADQTEDNILIPNDNVNYNTGYYRANSDTEVRAYYNDGSGTYIWWLIASLFSGENNQLVELFWEGGGFGKSGITDNWQATVNPQQLSKPQFLVKEPVKRKYINPVYAEER